MATVELKNNSIVKNLVRLLGIKMSVPGKVTDKKELNKRIKPIIEKISKNHKYKYNPDTLRNILTKSGDNKAPNEVLKFRLAHTFRIDNPEDLDVPEDFIKLRDIISISHLPKEKKEILKKILRINNPGRIKRIADAIEAEYIEETDEFKAELARKIKELEGRNAPLQKKRKAHVLKNKSKHEVTKSGENLGQFN